MLKPFLPVAFGLIGHFIAVSVWVNFRSRQVFSHSQKRPVSTESTVTDFLLQVSKTEGLGGAEWVEEEMGSFGEYHPEENTIKVPNLGGRSHLDFAICAHEISHAKQACNWSFLIKVSRFFSLLAAGFSYLFPLFVALGFLLYFPLVYVGVALYFATFFFLMPEVIIEINASKIAAGLLERCTDLTQLELVELKKNLRWAILSRLSFFTGGLAALVIPANER